MKRANNDYNLKLCDSKT
jgi:cation diffusion facilitator CzcD-associated flavoprotein CzcO